ncbi:hypothetical protein AB0D04_36405 [Streptomyces sp. NPDC048483]|uniref:hypothetical protein n=1 Tax=Streptomyces sp. NPDC048483 TaxID=3154927 RepID=UPI0034267F47
MDWLAPLNTLIGAGIGVGSTLLADRLRWRRDRVNAGQDARRQSYAAFMGALSDAFQKLHEVARGDHDPGEAQTRAHEVFVGSNLYPLRYQLVLIASWSVVEPTNKAFWKIRELRDLVARGVITSSPDFRRLVREYIDAAEEAQVAMRADLGTSWPQRDTP